MAEEPNVLVKAYFAIEDKYYGLMDFLEDNLRIPVYKYFVEPIESRGVPSFPIFIILLLAVFGGLFYLLQPTSFSLTVSVTSAETGAAIDDAQVLLIDASGETKTQLTFGGDAVFSGLSQSRLPFTIKVSKQGFLDGGTNVSQLVALVEVKLRPAKTVQPTVMPSVTPPPRRTGVINVRIFDDAGQPLSAEAQVVFYDVSTSIPIDQATSSGGLASSKPLAFGSRVQVSISATGFEPYNSQIILVDAPTVDVDATLQKAFYAADSNCGNEIHEYGEECDSSLEGCGPNAIGCGSTTCTCMYPTNESECGNGIQEYGEECDGTPTIPTSVCLADCTQVPGNATSTVFIVNATNNPLVADSIKIFKYGDSIDYAHTENASSFTAALLPSTIFFATASKAGFDPNSSGNFTTGQNVTIILNAINPEESGTVRILVLDELDGSVAGAFVRIARSPELLGAAPYDITNETGFAVFENVSFGDYLAVASDPFGSGKNGSAMFTLNSSDLQVTMHLSGGQAALKLTAIDYATNATLPSNTNPQFILYVPVDWLDFDKGFVQVSECDGQGCTATGLAQFTYYLIGATAVGYDEYSDWHFVFGSLAPGVYVQDENVSMIQPGAPSVSPSPSPSVPPAASCSDGTFVGSCSQFSLGQKCVDQEKPHLQPSCGVALLGLCPCADTDCCGSDGICWPRGSCESGQCLCDNRCIPEGDLCLPETLTIGCEPGTLKLKISGGQITLKADELFPYDAVQINVDTSDCIPGYHFDFFPPQDPCFKFDGGKGVFYYDSGASEQCKQLRPRSTLWRVGFSGQLYDLYIPVRLYAASELIPFVVDPIVSCAGEQQSRPYFSYVVDSRKNTNAVYKDTSFAVDGGLLTLLIRGRSASDLPVLPKPPGPMPACFYDYDYKGQVGLADADVITNNAGKFATWNNCSVQSKFVSCQLLDGNQDGRINARDKLGIAAHLGASCKTACFFDYNKDKKVDNADALNLSNYYGKLASQTCGSQSCENYDGNKDGAIDFLDSFGIQANSGKVCSDNLQEGSPLDPCLLNCPADEYIAGCLAGDCLQKYLSLFTSSRIQLDWFEDCSFNVSEFECSAPFDSFGWIGGPVIDYGFLYHESARCASSWCPVECGGDGMCSWVDRWQQVLAAFTKYLAGRTALQRGNGKPLSVLNEKLNKGLTFSFAIPMQVPAGNLEITSVFYDENIAGDDEVPPIVPPGGENQVLVPSMNWTVENRSPDAAVYKLSVSCSSWLSGENKCDWKYNASIIRGGWLVDSSNPQDPTQYNGPLKGICWPKPSPSPPGG